MRGLKRQRVCNVCHEFNVRRFAERQECSIRELTVEHGGRVVGGRRSSNIPVAQRVAGQQGRGPHQNAPEGKEDAPDRQHPSGSSAVADAEISMHYGLS